MAIDFEFNSKKIALMQILFQIQKRRCADIDCNRNRSRKNQEQHVGRIPRYF
jgi:hypothetical protein